MSCNYRVILLSKLEIGNIVLLARAEKTLQLAARMSRQVLVLYNLNGHLSFIRVNLIVLKLSVIPRDNQDNRVRMSAGRN